MTVAEKVSEKFLLVVAENVANLHVIRLDQTQSAGCCRVELMAPNLRVKEL